MSVLRPTSPEATSSTVATGVSKAIPKAKTDAILKEVIERERQATTGIGRGVGVPHARSAHVKQIVIAIGRVPRGVEFGAVDGERVKVVMLLISPKEGNAEHLAAMKSIVAIARDPYQRQRLISCGTAESFLGLLTEMAAESGVSVRIGHETRLEGLVETSVVTTGYGNDGDTVALVGSIGPTRMDYPGTIAAVRAVARYLSRVLGT